MIPNFMNSKSVDTHDDSEPVKGKTPEKIRKQLQMASKSPVGDRVDIHVKEDMFTAGSESESEEGDSTDGKISSINESDNGMSLDEESENIPSGSGRNDIERKEMLRNDPEVQELPREMLKEKGKNRRKNAKRRKWDKRSQSKTRSRMRSRSHPRRADGRDESNESRSSRSRSRSQPGKDDRQFESPGNNRNSRGKGLKDKVLIKSPSDTTLHSPVLKKGIVRNNLIDKISDFVENIWISDREKECKRVCRSERESSRSPHHLKRYEDREWG